MPVNITDVNAFTTPVTAPAGGDARSAASVTVGLQALANRTANLRARLDAPEQTANIAISANQSAFAPTGWATADVVRLNPTGPGFALLGLSASAATVKRKTLVNIDSTNTITLRHIDGGASADDRILCPGSADYVLGPRSSVEVISDLTSQGWRVVDTSIVSASSPISVIGAPTTVRYISPAAGDGLNWTVDAAGVSTTSIDAAVLVVPMCELPSGSFITRIRVGITITGAPGAGGAPLLSISTRIPNTTTGATVNTTTLLATGPIVAGNAILDSGAVSISAARNAAEQRIIFTAATLAATATALNWIEVTFADSLIGNG